MHPGSCFILTVGSSDENWANDLIRKSLEEAKTYHFKLIQVLAHYLQEKGFFGNRIRQIRIQKRKINNRLRNFSF